MTTSTPTIGRTRFADLSNCQLALRIFSASCLGDVELGWGVNLTSRLSKGHRRQVLLHLYVMAHRGVDLQDNKYIPDPIIHHRSISCISRLFPA